MVLCWHKSRPRVFSLKNWQSFWQTKIGFFFFLSMRKKWVHETSVLLKCEVGVKIRSVAQEVVPRFPVFFKPPDIYHSYGNGSGVARVSDLGTDVVRSNGFGTGVARVNGFGIPVVRVNGLGTGVARANVLDNDVARVNGFEDGVVRVNGFDADVAQVNGFDADVVRVNGFGVDVAQVNGFDVVRAKGFGFLCAGWCLPCNLPYCSGCSNLTGCRRG
jgi:hypothetical protein